MTHLPSTESPRLSSGAVMDALFPEPLPRRPRREEPLDLTPYELLEPEPAIFQVARGFERWLSRAAGILAFALFAIMIARVIWTLTGGRW